MSTRSPRPRLVGRTATLVAIAFIGIPSLSRAGTAFIQTNLTSDGTDRAGAPNLDANLKNAWGMAILPDGTFRVADQLVGKSTQYNKSGATAGPVVNIPFESPSTFSFPTGVVHNSTTDFMFGPSGAQSPAEVIFANINGSLSAYNPSVNANTATTVARGTGPAAYTGLARSTANGQNRLFAANPAGNKIDVYDGSFHPVSLPAGSFTDPETPSGLVPFNVAAVGDKIVVTYSIPGQEAREEEEGSGSVSVFNTDGTLVRHLVDGGALASPWGVALAPDSFGDFGGKLLIGNFNEEGHIHAFDMNTGSLAGTLSDNHGQALENDELWSLVFGNGQGGTTPDELYITAGVGDETGGRFAVIRAGEGGGGGGQAVPLPAMIVVAPGLFGIAAYAHRRYKQ